MNNVAVQSGQLNLAGGGESTYAQFTLSDTSALIISDGYSVDAGSTIAMASSTAQGMVIFDGGNTTVNCPITLFQITVERGQAILNRATTVTQMVLDPLGTLAGNGTVKVNGTFDWTGGMMTGGGTTEISQSATMFIFQASANGLRNGDSPLSGSTPAASNRTITNAGNIYWGSAVPITFLGRVTFQNAGRLDSEGGTLLDQGANDVFNNAGTFVVDGVQANGTVTMGAPFNNLDTGLVRIDAGTLSLSTGTSTGNWTLSDNTTLAFTGGGSGVDAQVYNFNQNTKVSYYADAEDSSGDYGRIVIQGAADGGLRVQGRAVSVQQLELDSGTISGYGTLVVNNQMIWSGGTMSNVRADGSDAGIGTIDIAANATLYMLGGADGTAPVLNRVMNIAGKVAWVGTTGDVSVTRVGPSPTQGTAAADFLNDQTMVDKAVSDILVPQSQPWRDLLGGYTNTVQVANNIANAIRALGAGRTFPSISIPAGWWQGIHFTAILPNGRYTNLQRFFAQLPAIMRASLETAIRGTPGTPSLIVLLRVLPNNLQQPTIVAFQGTLGVPPALAAHLRAATAIQWAKMSAGFLVGLYAGPTIGAVQSLRQVVSQLMEKGLLQVIAAMWNALVDKLATLIQDVANAEVASLLKTIFPDFAELYELYQQPGQLISYDGGYYLGKGIASIVSDVVLAAFTGGSNLAVVQAANGIKAAFAVIRNTIRVTGTVVRVVGRNGLAAVPGRAGRVLGRTFIRTGYTLRQQALAPLRALSSRGVFTHLTKWILPTNNTWETVLTNLKAAYEATGKKLAYPDIIRKSRGKPVWGSFNPETQQITLFRGWDRTTALEELLHWEDLPKLRTEVLAKPGWTEARWEAAIVARTGADWNFIYQLGESRVNQLMIALGFTLAP